MPAGLVVACFDGMQGDSRLLIPGHMPAGPFGPSVPAANVIESSCRRTFIITGRRAVRLDFPSFRHISATNGAGKFCLQVPLVSFRLTTDLLVGFADAVDEHEFGPHLSGCC